MSFLSKLKEKMGFTEPVDQYRDVPEDEYIEIETKPNIGRKSKVIVKPFVIESFNDVSETLEALREGYTIALINIKPLKDKWLDNDL